MAGSLIRVLVCAALAALLMSSTSAAQITPVGAPAIGCQGAPVCQSSAVSSSIKNICYWINENSETLANASCGSCQQTIGQSSRCATACSNIAAYEKELQAESLQCVPSSQGGGQGGGTQLSSSVSVAGIEVTQVIQDMNESVPLIAGKQTWVRVYLSPIGSPSSLTVTGTIQVQSSSGAVVTISPVAPAQIAAGATLRQMRASWTSSLDFQLPASLTTGATADTIVLATVAVQGGSSLGCLNCRSSSRSVTFTDAPPMRLRIVPIQYTDTNGVVVTPRAIDYTLLQSWLGRAYPTSQIIASIAAVQPTPVPLATLFTNTTSGCGGVNAFLAALRTVEEFSFPPFVLPQVDPRTHYYGMVLTDAGQTNGGFMRGCSPIGGFVSSGPTGPASLFPGGDNTQTFGDWYGGHEIGHSLGRAHPGYVNSSGVAVGYCGAGGPDTHYPYPNGQISDSQDDSVGLDVGDKANGIALAVLDGVSHFDVMSYCAQPQWMSDYTYENMLGDPNGLVANDPGGNGRPLGAVRAVLVQGRFVSVIASLDLTRKTGRFEFVQTVGAAPLAPAPSETRAVLQYADADGKALGRYEVNVNPVADAQPGEDLTALIDAQIPVVAGAARLDLYLGDKLLESRAIPKVPPVIRGLHLTAPGALAWEATAAPGAALAYFVQASRDGKSWEVLAMNLKTPTFALSPAQRRAYTSVRVFANDGFNSSVPVSIDLEAIGAAPAA